MVDLIVTDPPYNVNVSNSQGMTIQNDNMAAEEFQKFCNDYTKIMLDHLKPGGAFYVWHAFRTQREFENAIENAGAKVREQLVWVKSSLVLGRSDYQWRHEPCFYGVKDGGTRYFIDDRTLTTVKEDEPIELDGLTKDEMKELLEKTYNLPHTTIYADKPVKNESHPDMKPVGLFGYLIKNSSRPGETVLDVFGGSGTTIIACEQLGRKAYVMELDPRYADATIERWEKFTGEKAEKLN